MGAGVDDPGVGVPGDHVPVPSRQPRDVDRLAVKLDALLPPGGGFSKLLEELIGVGLGEEGGVDDDVSPGR